MGRADAAGSVLRVSPGVMPTQGGFIPCTSAAGARKWQMGECCFAAEDPVHRGMEARVVLTIWSCSLVGWHRNPGDLIQQLDLCDFSVHKPALPQSILHLEDWRCLVPSAIPCRRHHLLPGGQSPAQPRRRKPFREGFCAPKSTLNLHAGTTIHIT